MIKRTVFFGILLQKCCDNFFKVFFRILTKEFAVGGKPSFLARHLQSPRKVWGHLVYVIQNYPFQFSAEIEDLDPFDTSFASNIQPGKAELKVLESELI